MRTLIAILLAASAARAEPRWSEQCPKLKASLGDEADVIFARPPVQGPMPTFWRFPVGELSIALPRDEYDVLPRYDRGDHFSVLLNGRHFTVLIARDPLEPPQDDVFRKAGAPSTAAGREATRRLFGHAPSLLELARFGYRHRRADLTCREDRRRQEEAIAIALVLKLGAPDEVVYDALDGFGEITTEGALRSSWRRETRLEADGRRWLFTVIVPDPADRSALPPLALKRDRDVGAPTWLRALSAAVAKPDDGSRWLALEQALENPTEKSRAAVRALAHPDDKVR